MTYITAQSWWIGGHILLASMPWLLAYNVDKLSNIINEVGDRPVTHPSSLYLCCIFCNPSDLHWAKVLRHSHFWHPMNILHYGSMPEWAQHCHHFYWRISGVGPSFWDMAHSSSRSEAQMIQSHRPRLPLVMVGQFCIVPVLVLLFSQSAGATVFAVAEW